MILSCPICGATGIRRVFSLEHAPVYQMLKAGEAVTADCFAPLDVVRCQACGHLYNRSYAAELGDKMYRGDVLSNVPVHISMSQHLERIADWIGPEHYAGKRVVEIGAASGHLARILARDARSVVVFEPSAGLRTAMLPEKNIELVKETFVASMAPQRADLIVCRQVLEHLADPLRLLSDMRSALAPEGRLYLEVPRAEYIEERTALYDFLYAHVQYFHERNLLRLAVKAGFRLERSWQLKDEHDAGFLFSHSESAGRDLGSEQAPVFADDLAERIDDRRRSGRGYLSGLAAPIALYGANWIGLTFLSVHQSDRKFDCFLDNNADYGSYAVYSKTQSLPVRLPTLEVLRDIRTVIITAYLHQEAITETLGVLGYAGKVVSIEPELAEIPRANLTREDVQSPDDVFHG